MDFVAASTGRLTASVKRRNTARIPGKKCVERRTVAKQGYTVHGLIHQGKGRWEEDTKDARR